MISFIKTRLQTLMFYLFILKLCLQQHYATALPSTANVCLLLGLFLKLCTYLIFCIYSTDSFCITEHILCLQVLACAHLCPQ